MLVNIASLHCITIIAQPTSTRIILRAQCGRAGAELSHLVLVEVGEVVDDDGYRQRDDQHAADAARGADQLAPHRLRAHVAVADRRHGDRRPPERLRDADELGAGHIVLGEVG